MRVSPLNACLKIAIVEDHGDPAIKSLWKEGYQLCVPVQIVH